jgi:CheY-like chemotaxis protein
MSKRILIVDPSETIQILLSMHFSNAGHQVLVCSTPQEALKLLAHLEDAAPDLIFLDIDQKKEAYKVIGHLKTRIAYTHWYCGTGAERKAHIGMAQCRVSYHAISYSRCANARFLVYIPYCYSS